MVICVNVTERYDRKGVITILLLNTSNAWIAKQVLLVHVTVITLIGLYTIYLIQSVHNNVSVHSFIC